MAHPFDNPYAEREPVPPPDNFPSFNQFVAWARARGIAYQMSLLAHIYDDPHFRRTLDSMTRAEILGYPR